LSKENKSGIAHRKLPLVFIQTRSNALPWPVSAHFITHTAAAWSSWSCFFIKGMIAYHNMPPNYMECSCCLLVMQDLSSQVMFVVQLALSMDHNLLQPEEIMDKYM